MKKTTYSNITDMVELHQFSICPSISVHNLNLEKFSRVFMLPHNESIYEF